MRKTKRGMIRKIDTVETHGDIYATQKRKLSTNAKQ
jgi:hypothetical protein